MSSGRQLHRLSERPEFCKRKYDLLICLTAEVFAHSVTCGVSAVELLEQHRELDHLVRERQNIWPAQSRAQVGNLSDHRPQSNDCPDVAEQTRTHRCLKLQMIPDSVLANETYHDARHALLRLAFDFRQGPARRHDPQTRSQRSSSACDGVVHSQGSHGAQSRDRRCGFSPM